MSHSILGYDRVSYDGRATQAQRVGEQCLGLLVNSQHMENNALLIGYLSVFTDDFNLNHKIYVLI